MFNTKDILARLQAGERIEDIAQSAADALNAAKAEYDRLEDEKRLAEAKAKREAAELQKKKETNMRDIMENIVDYFTEFYADFVDADMLNDFHKHFDAAALVADIDKAVEEIKAIPSVAAELEKNPRSATVKLTGKEAKQAEDAINKFLKENDLF